MTPQLQPMALATVVVLLILGLVTLHIRYRHTPWVWLYTVWVASHAPLYGFAWLAVQNPFHSTIPTLLPALFASLWLHGPLLFGVAYAAGRGRVPWWLLLHALPALLLGIVLLWFPQPNLYEAYWFRFTEKAALLAYLVATVLVLVRGEKNVSPALLIGSCLFAVWVGFETTVALGWWLPEALTTTALIFLRSGLLLLWTLVLCIPEPVWRKLQSNKPKLSRPQRTTPTTAQALLADVNRVMESNQLFLLDGLTLAQLASQVGVTPYVLSEVLNQTYGGNFYQYLNAYRVQYAQGLVRQQRNKRWRVAEWAIAAGFNNRTSFTQAFKQHTGLTPTAFLKSLKATEPELD